MTLTIPSELKTLYNDSIDSVIVFAGVPCQLNYPAERTSTTVVGSSIGGFSSDFVLGGQQIPIFGQGNSMEQGTGYKETQVTEPITLCVYYNPKDWIKIGNLTLDLPAGSIQTKGYLSDLPKIMAAESLTVNTKIEGILLQTYKRSGNPVTHGFGHDRFILCMWELL